MATTRRHLQLTVALFGLAVLLTSVELVRWLLDGRAGAPRPSGFALMVLMWAQLATARARRRDRPLGGPALVILLGLAVAALVVVGLSLMNSDDGLDTTLALLMGGVVVLSVTGVLVARRGQHRRRRADPADIDAVD